MGASDIRICGEVGHVVHLERGDRDWPLPAEVIYRKGEVASWTLPDALMPGDRLAVPDSEPELMVRAVVATTVEGWAPLPMHLHIAFLATAVCPACGTRATHTVDIPTDLTFMDRFVVHTCITCDHSWRTEAWA